MYDTESGSVIDRANDLIQIGDAPLSPESVEIHHITREKANEEGIPIEDAVKKFIGAMRIVDCMVGHNTQFDRNIMTVEGVRCGRSNIFRRQDGTNMPEYCTMHKGKSITKIERTNKNTGRIFYKQPRLSELHDHLYDGTPDGTHDAMVDVLVCFRCYMSIRWNEEDVLETSPEFIELWNQHIK
jgi:DNA polymerase III epsilon subunit-like protein